MKGSCFDVEVFQVTVTITVIVSLQSSSAWGTGQCMGRSIQNVQRGENTAGADCVPCALHMSHVACRWRRLATAT